MPIMTYKLTKEAAADGSFLGYSRILLIGSNKAEIETLKKALPQGFECTIINKQHLNDEFKENGEFALNIMVNKKLHEAKQTGVHPGHSVAETVDIILKNVKAVTVSPQFMANFRQGLDFKIQDATNTLGMFGVEVGKTMQTFSQTISQLNKDWAEDENLSFMDKFGEFEDCDKVEKSINQFNRAAGNEVKQAPPVQKPTQAASSHTATQAKPPIASTTTAQSSAAQSKAILLPKPETPKVSDNAKNMAKTVHELIYDSAPTPKQTDAMAVPLEPFITDDLVKKIKDNGKLASPIYSNEAKDALDVRQQTLRLLGSVLRGSNTSFNKETDFLPPIAQATLSVLCFTPKELRQIIPELIKDDKDSIKLLVDVIGEISNQVNIEFKKK